MKIEDKEMDNNDNEVLIIEKKSKMNFIFSGVVLVVGILIGATVATVFSYSKSLDNYLRFEEEIKGYQMKIAAADKKNKNIEAVIEEKKQEVVEEHKKELSFQKEQEKANVSALNQRISMLNSQKATLQKKIEKQDEEITQLTHQVDLQVTMLSRAKELFQRQLQLKEEASALRTKIEITAQNAEQLSEECKTYLNGKSWDTKSDVCQRQEEASAQLQLFKERLQVLDLDIKEIDNISDNLGV